MRKNLFLYLALACFFGLIAIFIVDGYMGIYDTIYIATGEREQVIEPDFWLRQDRATPAGVKEAYYISTNREEKVAFRFAVDNRRFSSYTTDIEVSVWRMREKVSDVAAQTVTVAPFDRGRIEWTIDNTELLPNTLTTDQRYEYTVNIKKGEIERNIIMYIDQTGYPIKPIPAIPPPIR